MKIKFLIFFIFITYSLSVFSQDAENLKGIQNDIFLHPADGFTAYTLKKNEFIYNQSPFTLPMPSWAWWGITDKITAEIDLLPLVGGFFQEPHLPVPSFNFRFKLLKQNRFIPETAFEIMYQHLWNENFLSDSEDALVSRQGNSLFERINISWRIKHKMYIHISAGTTYSENLFFGNNDSTNIVNKFYKKSFTPDLSYSIDYRFKPYMSLNATVSYGTTFVYLDNVPRKYQISYGFRIAPFFNSKKAFLKSFRAEIIGYYIYLPDINASIKTLLPVFPYFYWQWTNKKKK